MLYIRKGVGPYSVRGDDGRAQNRFLRRFLSEPVYQSTAGDSATGGFDSDVDLGLPYRDAGDCMYVLAAAHRRLVINRVPLQHSIGSRLPGPLAAGYIQPHRTWSATSVPQTLSGGAQLDGHYGAQQPEGKKFLPMPPQSGPVCRIGSTFSSMGVLRLHR
jgi:hypothetical protein